MTRRESVDESTDVRPHTKLLLSVPRKEGNMKASSHGENIKQTEHGRYVMLQGAGASIKLYCPCDMNYRESKLS